MIPDWWWSKSIYPVVGGHARAGESIDLWIVLFNTITNIRNWVLSGASRDWEIRTGERKSKGGRGRAYWPGPINECHGGGFSPGNLEIMGEGKKIVLKVTEMQVLHWVSAERLATDKEIDDLRE